MASTGVFAFNQGTATTVDGSLGELMTSLQGSLDDLGGFVTAVKASWDGDEMELYGTIQKKWDDSAKQVQEILEGVKKGLSSVNTSFGDLRQSVRDAMKEA